MSGIEVLGLVLGAIPLLIAAFEHLRDASEAKDLLIHFKRQHSKCWNKVKDEDVIFRLHLQKLLLPLVKVDVLDGNEIDALMLQAGGPNWKDDDLQAALRQRLGEAYDRYVEILEETPKTLHRLFMMMGCKLSRFQDRINAVQNNSNVSKARIMLKANAYFLGQQVRFAVQRATREELLQELHENIQKLETFLTMSTEVATLRKDNTAAISRNAVRALTQYGQHANRLYELIYKRWCCTCKPSHCAHLWLQHHVNAPFELRLLVLFAPRGSNSHALPPWQQQGLQILWGEMQSRSSPMPFLSPAKQYPAPLTKTPLKSSTLSPLKGIMSRSQPEIYARTMLKSGDISAVQGLPCAALPTASASTQPAPKRNRGDTPENSQSQQLQREISNLCETLAGCSMVAECVGSLTDQQLGCSYQVLSQPRQKITAEEISLHEILDPAREHRLPPVKRFQIALKVASSHLKLHSTRWVRKQWESRDIRFPYTRGTDSKQIMFDDPYVAADFNDATSRQETPSAETGRSFVSLGIILLELLFGTTLERHRLWQWPHFRENRLMIARMWADDAEDEGGPIFSSVIMWCLNESPTTLQDERWREDLAKKVVLPLEQCCKWIWVMET